MTLDNTLTPARAQTQTEPKINQKLGLGGSINSWKKRQSIKMQLLACRACMQGNKASCTELNYTNTMLHWILMYFLLISIILIIITTRCLGWDALHIAGTVGGGVWSRNLLNLCISVSTSVPLCVSLYLCIPLCTSVYQDTSVPLCTLYLRTAEVCTWFSMLHLPLHRDGIYIPCRPHPQ